MKRKITYLGMLALTGAFIFMTPSCSKDYDGDIADLRQQVEANKTAIAALQDAINKGKLIKSVDPTADGFLITFSDNSTITVKHGTNGQDGMDGTDGTDGTNGTNGTNGKDGFAPIVGIDSEGYWTIVRSEGGKAERIKDANGNDVKAVASVPQPNKTTGTWWIDGKDTGVPTTGKDGIDGNDGVDGNDGKDGVDGHSPYVDKTTGTWMIWDSEKGAFVDSGIIAKGEDGKDGPVGPVGPQGPKGDKSVITIENGFLYIDGVSTGIAVPAVVIVEGTHSVAITVKDENGVEHKYDVALSADVRTMVTGVQAPVASPLISILYGEVGADVEWSKTESFKSGDILFGNGMNEVVVPVVVNPTNADLAAKDKEGNPVYSVSIIDPNGKELAVGVESFTKGYDYDKYGFPTKAVDPSANNGLWTIKLKVDKDNLIALQKQLDPSGDKKNLAVRIVDNTDNRTIVSGYQYTVNAAQASDATITQVVTPTQSKLYIPIGKTVSFFSDIAEADAPLYRALIGLNESTADPVAKCITIVKDEKNANAAISTVEDAASTASLSDQEVTFATKALDLNGNIIEKKDGNAIKATFYTPLNSKAIDPLPALRHQLVSDPQSKGLNTVVVPLKPFFDQLGAAKTTLWQTRVTAASLAVAVKDANDKAIVNSEIVPTLAKAADGTAWTSSDGNAALSHIKFVFDTTKCSAGSFSAEMTFTDSKPYKDEFPVIVPITVTNPDASEEIAKISHVSALFNGNKLAIYGDYTNHKSDVSIDYVLGEAYNGLPAWGDCYGFEVVKPEDLTNWTDPMKDNKTAVIKGKTVNNEYEIELCYYYFGNKTNKQKVETILVKPSSSVYEGSLKEIKKMSMKYGSADVVKLSESNDVLDYKGVALNVFKSAKDDRAKTVTVAAAAGDPNAKLLKIAVGTDNEWTITSATEVAGINAQVDVKVIVTVTDQFGIDQTFETKVTVTK